MRKLRNFNSGFSLTECLLAIGILAVGMLFIAGVFPVGIHFTTVAAERTIAAVVADEAFAKIRLYGVADFNSPPWPLPNPVAACLDFSVVSFGAVNPIEFAYPSEPNMDVSRKQYYWSALCRRVDLDPNSRLVQVTVFVSRKVSAGAMYWYRDPLAPPAVITAPSPVPVWINISQPVGFNPINLLVGDAIPADIVDEITFVNDGYTIVDNMSGQIYRVLERDAAMPDMIVLDRPWQGGPTGSVWVVPPPIGGGRCPCIAIYQRVIRF